KRGIVDFATGLVDLGVELVSTGGTAQELESAGVGVRTIDDLTGFPEIMDGRVKTLHPKLYAGLLAVRDNPEHVRAATEHDIEYVDLVVVNLYPFERTAARLGTDEAEVIENIDIGGPTMIRAAAKNHAFCAVVVHPESYAAVLDELREADRRAYASDPLSAYGGVVVLNRRVDRETAGAIAEQFVEALFAPGFDDGALEVLGAKPNLRILEDRERRLPLLGEKDMRQVTGG